MVARKSLSKRHSSLSALEVSIAGSNDKITFNGFFYAENPNSAYNALQQISFSGGPTWNLNDILNRLSNHPPVFMGAGGRPGIVTTDLGSASDCAYDIVVAADGKYLLTGQTVIGGYSDFALARYNSNGTLDTSFDGDGKVITDLGSFDKAQSVTVQSDGKILVFASSGNGSVLLRYNSDGSRDNGFGSNGKVTAAVNSSGFRESITVQSDGKIVVAGQRYNTNSYDFALARYNSDGSLDTAFGSNGLVTTAVSGSWDAGFSVKIDADGKIVVAGGEANADGSGTDFALVRYNADGTLDSTFGAVGIADRTVNSGSLFSYTVPANMFVDPDDGDTLTFSATQTSGSPLPSWLSFDSVTRTFSGTPAAGDSGTFTLEVKATDQSGASATSNAFSVSVVSDNHPPTGNVVLSGTAMQNQTLTASNTLADADGMGTLAYQWQSSADGSAWSIIAGATASSFTLSEAQVGRQVRVTASYTDGHGTPNRLPAQRQHPSPLRRDKM